MTRPLVPYTKRILYRLIDAVSFNGNIRDLADLLNRRAGQPEDNSQDLLSHPGGFTRAFHKRRMGMAGSYIRIAQNLGRRNCRERLYALKTLIELSFHAKTVSIPLNTARVQIEIMKEAVKNIHNRRRQMEMITDFAVASYGHEAAIRKYLRELGRIEVAESARPLKDLDVGWDAHVHDYLSEGRKTPSQLSLDAFVKGMSRLTVAYYDIPHRDILFEAMEAGRILGVDVTIGIEFSIGKRYQRKHFFFLPPASDFDGFLFFFDTHCRTLARFVDGLEANRRNRQEVITEILEHFNRNHRITLNEGYAGDTLFTLPPLRFSDLEKMVPYGQYSRSHLGELLFVELRRVLKRRVLAQKVQYAVSRQLHRREMLTGWEMERIEAAYRKVREQYRNLNPGDLKRTYFSGKRIMDYDSAFAALEDILPDLKTCGGTIVYNRPLEQGFAEAVSTIVSGHRYIDRIELMNMQDSMNRDPSEIIQLSRFVDLINNGGFDELKQFLEEWPVDEFQPELLQRAFDRYHETPLVPVLGSAATGRVPQVPGMGFVQMSRIPPKFRRHFTRTHYRIPRPVSSLVIGGGRRPEAMLPETEIYSLGKSGQFRPNLAGDEEESEWIGPRRAWRYLNPVLKNLIRIGIGFVPAYLWVGLEFALIWFGITFVRNVIVDLIAFSGFRIRTWSVRGIDFDNVSQSLFWTGFSVPVLGSVKLAFDYAWPFPFMGPAFVWSRFFVICIANGFYIAAHNTLRRFDSRVIRANFFRSVLAWPFSAFFAPVGNLLLMPSIVQAKFWSDAVGAFIEGSGKFRQKIVLRKRDLMEILPLLRSPDRDVRLTALLDILYIWARRQRGRTGLLHILTGRDGSFDRLRRFRRTGAHLPADREEKVRIGTEFLDLLLERCRPHQAQIKLAQFVLSRYSDREAVVLTDLINRNLVPFHSWLKRLRKPEKH